MGDDPRWKQVDWDDSDWDYSGRDDYYGNFWGRFQVDCDTFAKYFNTVGMTAISVGSFELYWDEVLLGKNGIVGANAKEEFVGKFLTHWVVPDSLMTIGIHTIAFRVSNHNQPKIRLGSWNLFYIEEYLASHRRDLELTAKIMIFAGIYLMGAIYYLFLFVLRHRYAEVLIFSVLCFLFFSLILMEYIKFLWLYPYTFHFTRLLIIYLLTLTISILTPIFYLLYFNIPKKKWVIPIIIFFITIVQFKYGAGGDLTNERLSTMMWALCFTIVSYATFVKLKESRIILVVLIIVGFIIAFNDIGFRALLYEYDITLFVSFSLIVLSMMYLLARRAKKQKEAYEASLLLSARLQNQLLKKNIQPHFIMNTLTSLMEWVEEAPKESVNFIEALSDEFEVMSEIAEKKLIPIEQEIALCEHHIRIMKFRKEVDYIFETEGIQEDELIPPAVIHTLVENGITHNRPNEKNQVKMVLSFSESDKGKKYTLITFAKPRSSTSKKAGKGGTGLKYIKSRLTENYGVHWELESYGIEEGWKNIITIKS